MAHWEAHLLTVHFIACAAPVIGSSCLSVKAAELHGPLDWMCLVLRGFRGLGFLVHCLQGKAPAFTIKAQLVCSTHLWLYFLIAFIKIVFQSASPTPLLTYHHCGECHQSGPRSARFALYIELIHYLQIASLSLTHYATLCLAEAPGFDRAPFQMVSSY